VIYIWIQKDK